MNFWTPGAEAPGVDRVCEDEGVYIVDDSRRQFSIEKQVSLIFHVFMNREAVCPYTIIERRFCRRFLLFDNYS